MLATAVTIALFGFVALLLGGMLRVEGKKMLAALQGQSWASRHSAPGQVVTIRVSPRYPASRPVRARPALRAAA